MNNYQLTCILSSCTYTRNLNYLVCAKDGLPSKVEKKPTIIIMNDENSTKPGRHWVCVFIPKKGECCFFDSLGKSPLTYSEHLHNLMLSIYPRYYCNKFSYQAIDSNSCGKFCLYFVISRAKGLSVEKILNSLCHSNKYVNESLIAIFYGKVKKSCNYN